MKVKKISFIDKFGLMLRTFKKNFARTYRNKYDKYIIRKIYNLTAQQEKHFKKWDLIYSKYLKDYQRYIGYLKYKELHNK